MQNGQGRSGAGREKVETAGEVAYQHLKRQILICELQPSTELRAGDLAAETGFGRTPVREALTRLVHEGLVEVRPRQGYRVQEITAVGAREAHELRLLLEPAAVELAVERATDAELEALHDLAHASYDYADRETYERFVLANRQFHVQLAACGNRRLATILERLMEDLQRLYFRSLSFQDTAGEQMHEHHDLYDAVLQRDAQAARSICVEQIQASHERVVAILLSDLTGPALRQAHAVLHTQLTPHLRRPHTTSGHW